MEDFFSNGMIIGVDECGKGSWAGPMYVVALAAPQTWSFDVKDSKAYKTHAARQKVRDRLVEEPELIWYTRCVTAKEIDDLGMGRAHQKAVQEAITACLNMMAPLCPGLPERIIFDGNGPQPLPGVECIPKADSLFPQVSAASVLAKVQHDNEMVMHAMKYPGYGFETNMGYGSEKHEQALVQLGLCPLHRRSFNPMKNYLSVAATSVSSPDEDETGQGADDPGDAGTSKPARRHGRGTSRRSTSARGRTR